MKGDHERTIREGPVMSDGAAEADITVLIPRPKRGLRRRLPFALGEMVKHRSDLSSKGIVLSIRFYQTHTSALVSWGTNDEELLDVQALEPPDSKCWESRVFPWDYGIKLRHRVGEKIGIVNCFVAVPGGALVGMIWDVDKYGFHDTWELEECPATEEKGKG
jgi:hypothetical protein